MADGAFSVFDQANVFGGLTDVEKSRLYLPADARERREFAETHLLKTRKEASCTLGLTSAQKAFGRKTGAIVGLLGMWSPGLLFQVLSGFLLVLFSILIIHRSIVIVAGIAARLSGPTRDLLSGARRKTFWPHYSVLVAVYREPRAVPGLVAALKGLDYPKRQLDIQILIEEEDEETLTALLALKLKPHFRIVPVPKGNVQTKPRALNYGLSLARGQYVAIYDAEDQMHSGQLKAAIRAFQSGETSSLCCVQAPLIPHNGRESWIARQFQLEYLTHFRLIIPGLTICRAPVMLGGTSNHFRRDILEKVGGWDPYNVTEDADLGLRLSAAGYRIGVISPPTYEEAPVRCRQWIGQRSRWIKGFIQTLGVFTRNPLKLIRQMGVIRWASAMALLGGAVFSAVAHGPLAIWLLMCVFVPGLGVPDAALLLLATGFGLHLLGSVFSWDRVSPAHVLGALSAPLYWPLQTLAAIKAVHELITRPYFWDKTEHGLTQRELCRSRLRS